MDKTSFDKYEIKKEMDNMIKHGENIQELINRNISVLENDKFKEIYPWVYHFLTYYNCGYVKNPHTKHCNCDVFYREFNLKDEYIKDIIEYFIEAFDLEVINNFKNHTDEAMDDVINDIHKDNLHHYGIFAFTDNIPLRYVIKYTDKDDKYEKTYDLLSKFGVYYCTRLLDEMYNSP